MIRWYDWAFAIVLADLVQSFIFAGFFATTVWQPIVYGLIAGLIIRGWLDGYCQFRLRMEIESGQ
jgi:hypothetical protein